MRKTFLKYSIIGAVAGIALNYLAAIAISCALDLGYFTPCIATLPEFFGGEMNAVLFQLAVCTLLGAGIGAGICIMRFGKRRVWQRLLCSAAAIICFLIPAAIMAACMLR